MLGDWQRTELAARRIEAPAGRPIEAPAMEGALEVGPLVADGPALVGTHGRQESPDGFVAHEIPGTSPDGDRGWQRGEILRQAETRERLSNHRGAIMNASGVTV
jgi:hypothetical protein